MKPSLAILPLVAAVSFVAASHALAQQPGENQPLVDSTLVHTAGSPQPTASPTEQPDVFDALKKGISKVQKQTREAKELEPEVKALKKEQDTMQQELAEARERLHAVLAHQSDEITRLQAAVAHLEAEVKSLKAAPTPTATPAQP